MAQTFTTSLSGNTSAQAHDNVHVNTTTLRTSFSGSSSPGSPVQGQLWLDTSASEYVLKVYADLEGTGAGWYEVGRVLHGNLDLGNNEMVDVRLENKGSHTTPASGVVGEVYLLTGDSKARVIVSATEREVLLSANNTDYFAVDAYGSMQRDATNPPTAATKGTTPTVRGWLFDATNELASFTCRAPQGYSADADVKLRLLCILNQAETAGDDIDWTCNYVVRAPGSAELVSDTSTAATVASDLGSTVADGSVHVVDLTLAYNDATNPIAAGDIIAAEISRTNLTNCGGVILVGAAFLFPVGNKITE